MLNLLQPYDYTTQQSISAINIIKQWQFVYGETSVSMAIGKWREKLNI